MSRKFRPVGPDNNLYFAPEVDDFEEAKKVENKWSQKRFVDVYKLMSFLCFEQNIYKNSDGSTKNYTVCYEDRFLGIIETEVWRFHQEMDIPSHRVRMIKLNGETVWDRAKKFSAI